MRQVPRYAIVGNGRVAKHLCHYFDLLKIPYQHWSRSFHGSLSQTIKNCSHVLILINDSAIQTFIQENPVLQNKILIHFSGQLSTPLAYSAHPLMTFTHNLYDLQTYQKIPFIIEQRDLPFAKLLPGLNNPHVFIPTQLKAYYHALCVLSNNFTNLLWRKFFSELQHTFQWPKEIGFPYLEQTFQNLRSNSENSLTGPLTRGDKKTIAANLQALKNDPYQKIYQAFVEMYEAQKQELTDGAGGAEANTLFCVAK